MPATRLTKFSDPEATATLWEETRRVLEEAELFWLSTVRADGRPHVTPVVAVWSDDAVWFQTGEGEQKVVNLRGNPQVVLTAGRNEWDGGLDVVVEGTATPVADVAVLGRLVELFGAKWDGRWRWSAHEGGLRSTDGDGEAIVFRVEPAKVFAHSKGDPFGETRHTFE